MLTADQLTILTAYLAALSAVTERGVEIIKGLSSYLKGPHLDPKKEWRRQWWLRVISIIVGFVSALLAAPATEAVLGEVDVYSFPRGFAWCLGLGFLASAGSSFWNPILGYLKAIKDLKKSVEVKARLELLQQSKASGTISDEELRFRARGLLAAAGL
jgi:hypothetical protein